MGARTLIAIAGVLASLGLARADAAVFSKPVPFVSVANGRNLAVDKSQFADFVLLARNATQVHRLSRYLPPQSEPRERLEQLDFERSVVVAVAQALPDGRAIRVVGVSRKGATLHVSAEIWPIPRYVFVTGTIVFTYDAVRLRRSAVGRPLPRAITLKVRKAAP